jgi:hypothetical protein
MFNISTKKRNFEHAKGSDCSPFDVEVHIKILCIVYNGDVPSVQLSKSFGEMNHLSFPSLIFMLQCSYHDFTVVTPRCNLQ